MPSPAGLRLLGHVYLVLAALFWPVTTLISTAYALKLKLPPLPGRPASLPSSDRAR